MGHELRAFRAATGDEQTFERLDENARSPGSG